MELWGIKIQVKALRTAILALALPLAWQNCSNISFDSAPVIKPAASVKECENDDCTPVAIAIAIADCEFNGSKIPSGKSVTAYLESTGICQSETRACNNGRLSGTYQFASCTPSAPVVPATPVTPVTPVTPPVPVTPSVPVTPTQPITPAVTPPPPADCLFDGRTIAHGSVVSAFQNPSVAYGASCVAEARLCNNGVLSGSYNYATCGAGQPNACLFKGKTIAHGGTQKAYRTSSVGYGGICDEETRRCENGAMSGTFENLTCSPGAPLSCEFNGEVVAHGQKKRAFRDSAVAFGAVCESEMRECVNGDLLGSFTKASCNVGGPLACSFQGRQVAHGENVLAYAKGSVEYGQTCQSQPRTCNNGTLNGSFTHGTCNVICTAQNSTCLYLAIGRRLPDTVNAGEHGYWQDRIAQVGFQNSLLEANEYVRATTVVLQRRGLTTGSSTAYINAGTTSAQIDTRRQFVFDLLVHCSGSGTSYSCQLGDSTALYTMIGRRMPDTVGEAEHQYWNDRIRQIGYAESVREAQVYTAAVNQLLASRGKTPSTSGAYINAGSSASDIAARKSYIGAMPIACGGQGFSFSCQITGN